MHLLVRKAWLRATGLGILFFAPLLGLTVARAAEASPAREIRVFPADGGSALVDLGEDRDLAFRRPRVGVGGQRMDGLGADGRRPVGGRPGGRRAPRGGDARHPGGPHARALGEGRGPLDVRELDEPLWRVRIEPQVSRDRVFAAPHDEVHEVVVDVDDDEERREERRRARRVLDPLHVPARGDGRVEEAR